MIETLIWFLLYIHSFKPHCPDKGKSSLTAFSIISCWSLPFSVQAQVFMQEHNLISEAKISLETKGKCVICFLIFNYY